MIKLDYKNDKIYIGQQTTPPVVYLDQWAFKMISLDVKLSDIFVNQIKQKSGTLVISYMNLMEFALLTDDTQIASMELFLNKLSPDNIGFIEVNPDAVIKRENEIIRTKATNIAPHQDNDLLNTFTGKITTDINPYLFNGFLKLLRGPVLKDKNDKFMEGSSHLLKELRLRKKSDKAYQNELTALIKGPKIQHATRYVAYDMFRQLVNDSAKSMTNNDWKDFLHSVVPISYCDIILLDKGWVHKANTTITRLKKCGLINQNPYIYSSKNINNFWERLEAWA